MISVLTWCYSRQDMLDITLPLWLKQEGVDYEIVLGHGPTIKWPSDPRINPVLTPNLKMCESYNAMLKEAKGDILLITQSDMQVNSPTQLKRMLAKWSDRKMVTERFFKEGRRDPGIYLQFMMVSKMAVIKAGGWCELFDNPESCAHEDSDLVSTMLEQGMDFENLETPEDEGVYHIDHPKPDYANDPVMIKRLAVGKAIYNCRHDKSVIQLYAQQFANQMMRKRLCL